MIHKVGGDPILATINERGKFQSPSIEAVSNWTTHIRVYMVQQFKGLLSRSAFRNLRSICFTEYTSRTITPSTFRKSESRGPPPNNAFSEHLHIPHLVPLRKLLMPGTSEEEMLATARDLTAGKLADCIKRYL